MTRLLALLCILAGATLIYLSITRRPRRKYITLSGHVQGRSWAGRIPA